MRLIILFDMFLNPSFKVTTSFAYKARTTAIERIQKLWKRGDSRRTSQNKLDKACFQHEMPDGDFKDLPRRRPSNKVLYDKAFNLAENPKYYGYHRKLASTFYKCFTKFFSCSY